MQVYLVGGAVRDALLGLPMQDRDWVVVGATPEMLLAQGYRSVGKDFPVFLHPRTHDEYALARTERKTAPGYRGFAVHAAPDVTLEEDLARRDLTINAIAVPASCVSAQGSIDIPSAEFVDPFGGRQDLQHKILRHVTSAFSEDPVRILRVARLAARFADFTIAEPTRQLMRAMVREGEVQHLVGERVWQELARGLMERSPARLFEVLQDCGALADLLPGAKLESDPHLRVLDLCAQRQASLPVRAACLLLALSNRELELGLALSKQLPLPTDCRELAQLLAREHDVVQCSHELTPAALLDLLERCDALRRPQRFDALLLACECDARTRHATAASEYPVKDRLLKALGAARSVAVEPLAQRALTEGSGGARIGELIHQARVQALSAATF